jgi:ABC-type multidrug transport system ATPase subunit/ABC-type multidrug transport system permease subunit
MSSEGRPQGSGRPPTGGAERPRVLGRDESCDIPLIGEGISRRHAQITRRGAMLVVEDLGSANGTWLNGNLIAGPAALSAGDVLGIGTLRLEVTADGRLKLQTAPVAATSGSTATTRVIPAGVTSPGRIASGPTLTIEGRELTFDVPARRLLEGASLTLFSSDFAGLMGPSGAGKTTLMNLLNGYLPPSYGNVLVNGADLYSRYGECSGLLGYVPQDDIMHRDLTVRQALRFTGRLRLPPETTDRDIDERIAHVVGQLQIESTLDVLIGSPEKKGISGGQRKRVNLAMELLTDPSVLFLDEPTSGLSSEDTLTVMKLLRKLADAGKCILLTLHQPSLESFRLMTHLIVVSRDPPAAGKVVYFGPAYPDSIYFFNPEQDSKRPAAGGLTPDEVLRGLSKRPTAEWEAKYRDSDLRARFVAGRAGRMPAAGQAKPAPRRNRNPIHQCATLVRRNLTIKLADRWNTAVLLAQAPVIAFLVVLVFGQRAGRDMTADNWAATASATATSVFLMCLASIWFGCSNAAREIVGEWAVYHRERMVNLRIPAYVFSKLLVGTILCAIQCAVLLLIVRWGCNLRGAIFSSYIVLMTAACCGIGIGLIISALAPSQEMAMGLLPLVLIPMVIFGGSLMPVHEMQKLVRPAAFVMPTRHGFEALMLLESARKPLGPSPYSNTIADPSTKDRDRPDIAEHYLPEHRRLGIPKSTAALAILFGASAAAILLILRYRDVH